MGKMPEKPISDSGSAKVYQMLFQKSPEGLVYTGEDNIIVDANEEFCAMFGYSRADVIGANLDDIVAVTAEMRESDRSVSARFRAEKTLVTTEIVRQKKDGTPFPVSIMATPLFIDGKPSGALTIYRDISGRKEQEATRNRQIKLQRTAAETASILATEPDPGKALPAVFQKAADFLPIRCFCLTEQEKPFLMGSKNMIWTPSGQQLSDPGDSTLLEKLLTGDTAFTTSIDEVSDAAILAISTQVNALSLVTLPLECEHGSRFLITVFMPGRKEDISANEHDYMLFFRDLLKGYLSRAVTRRELETSRKRYETILETHPELILRYTPDLVVTYANRAYCEYHGRTLDDVVGHSFVRSVAPEDVERVREQFLSLTPENPVRTQEEKALMKNGDIRWQEWTDRGIFDAKGTLLEIQCVGRDITQKKVAEEKLFEAHQALEHTARTDGLTGVINRQHFNSVLEKAINLTKTSKKDFSLILFDLDDFKTVNDSFGHLAGDGTLTEAVEHTRKMVRDADAISRWGGDEFAILTPQDIHGACRLAKRIRSAMEEMHLSSELKLTASFGVAQIKKSDTVESITLRADNAMYAAKKAGKNRVECYGIPFAWNP